MLIRDALINEYTALILELVYVVDVANRSINIVLGYLVYMPEINSIYKVEQGDFDSKLIHGPSETINRDLIMAGWHDEKTEDNQNP